MLELAWTLHGYCKVTQIQKKEKESVLGHLLCNFTVLGQTRKHLLTHLSVRRARGCSRSNETDRAKGDGKTGGEEVQGFHQGLYCSMCAHTIVHEIDTYTRTSIQIRHGSSRKPVSLTIRREKQKW